ncbi:erythroblast NAD(P)(+)--arginine ADP-ribosyltransferase-like [Stegostoma tigrinum]|uniref:erythroblast NAD(P)(+)--arginine ADP-ribosyltransferase-like n=1 Tax=Stegostoma tigrinum TaxID=3053191 RepID=UPI00286FD022|nr:erythroblast NAD(P)(+)--arginine ADP-ribosyltransferase-like [Stegostoma tigrinum]
MVKLERIQLHFYDCTCKFKYRCAQKNFLKTRKNPEATQLRDTGVSHCMSMEEERRRGTMCDVFITLLTALCFGYRGTALEVNVPKRDIGREIQMDMGLNSAAYLFTQSCQADGLARAQLEKDRRANQVFDNAWRKANSCMAHSVIPRGLTKDHIHAVYTYTASYIEDGQFYKVFNEAVREYGANDTVYARDFKFKSFHYLLTVALEQLRKDRPHPRGLTYRGVRLSTNAPQASHVRFGFFVSSSLSQRIALNFTNLSSNHNTWFQIDSKFGVPIMDYSCFPEEMEVLIPTYEVFRVNSVTPWNSGTNITLTGEGKLGVAVEVKRGKNGSLVVVRCQGTANSLSVCLWILLLLVLM